MSLDFDIWPESSSPEFKTTLEGFPSVQDVLTLSDDEDESSVVSRMLKVMRDIRGLGVQDRIELTSLWCADSVFEFIERHLQSPEKSIRSDVLEILSVLASSWIGKVRGRCSDSDVLFGLLIRLYHDPASSEPVVAQVSDLLRLLLEPSYHSDSFIEQFYEKEQLQRVCAPLVSGIIAWTGNPFTLQSLLDLVSFCIISHNHVAKGYFLRFGSLLKCIRQILTAPIRSHSTYSTTKMVQLAAIRLVRAFMWQKDTLYLRHLSAFNIPSLILQLVHQHRPTHDLADGNLIYSSALEVITFVCVNSQIAVIESLCKLDSESEYLVRLLAADDLGRAHSELAQFMLATMERINMQHMYTNVDDLNSRHSVSSSRCRSSSPHPLVMPLKRRSFEDDEEKYLIGGDEDESSPDPDVVPKTPGESPASSPVDKRQRLHPSDSFSDS